MPLQISPTKSAFQANVRELYHSNKTKPPAKRRSRAQILAISYRIQRGSRNKGRSVRRRPGYQSGGLVKVPSSRPGLPRPSYPKQRKPFLSQPQNLYNQPHQGQPLMFHPGAAR